MVLNGYSDGEKALIEAAKCFGPNTRRLVERWHAKKNIEHDLEQLLDRDAEQIRDGFIYYSSYFWWNFPRRGAGGYGQSTGDSLIFEKHA